MIRIVKGLVLTAVFFLALWLLRDASIIALSTADPATGRIRACYTDLEILLGFKRPTTWVRPAELVVAVVIAVGGALTLVGWYRGIQKQERDKSD